MVSADTGSGAAAGSASELRLWDGRFADTALESAGSGSAGALAGSGSSGAPTPASCVDVMATVGPSTRGAGAGSRVPSHAAPAIAPLRITAYYDRVFRATTFLYFCCVPPFSISDNLN